MKILFTFYTPSGGMETLNRIRCKALNDTGFECHILYTMDGDGRKNIKGIRTYITHDNEEIRRIIERENYDVIVVCTDIMLLQTMKEYAEDCVFIFEIQGLGMLDNARRVVKELESRILQHADALLYPNTSHLKALMNEHFSSLPQFCYDNPLDTTGFGYVSYPPKQYPIIGWIGRIEQNKNWRDFLAIGQRLLVQHPNLYLWIFDDANLYEPAEKADFDVLSRSVPFANRLVRNSGVPHDLMADYYSMIGDSGGFVCSTSVLEGFGYSVAEAMLCRCPVLATDSDGVRRFINHNKTGKFFKHGDINQAVDEARSLMLNQQLRESIRLNGEEYIKNNFTTSLYCRRFRRMVKELRQNRIGN